jgi:hypothetical protein
VEARKEPHFQPATDVDFHSKGIGGEGLHLALGIHSMSQKHYYPDEHNNPKHSTDSEEDGLL